MSYSDDINIAARKAAQELCDHRFIPDTGFGFTCRYCGLQMLPVSTNVTKAKFNDTTKTEWDDARQEIVSDTLKQVNLWNSGKISKERLSELLGMNFYELDKLLVTDSTYNLLWFVVPYLQDILWESHNSEFQLKAIMEMITDLYKQLKSINKIMKLEI